MNWKHHLTKEEARQLDRIDKLKAKWQEANKARAGIANRAIHRAIYESRKKGVDNKDNLT